MSPGDGQYPKSDALQEAADRFNALLDQYGPRPQSTEELLELMNKQMPRYALAMVGGFGVIGALVGLEVGAGMTQHAAPGMARLPRLAPWKMPAPAGAPGLWTDPQEPQ